MKSPPTLLSPFLLSGSLLLPACSRQEEPPPPPLSERVTWEGHSAAGVSLDAPLPSDPPGSAGDSAGPRKAHIFDFLREDTVRLVLREYARDYQAFRAFQEKAAPEEIEEGFYRDGNSLVFAHGRFLGDLRYARTGLIPGSFLKERLVFQGEELFRRPEIFRSFPVAGQIPGSERVVSADFLGPGGGEVFLMRYRCGDDTAALFRGFGTSQDSIRAWPAAWKGKTDTLSWSRRIHFSGASELGEPRKLRIFKGGFLGVEGCFDPGLAEEYAEKLEKMTVLLHEP